METEEKLSYNVVPTNLKITKKHVSGIELMDAQSGPGGEPGKKDSRFPVVVIMQAENQRFPLAGIKTIALVTGVCYTKQRQEERMAESRRQGQEGRTRSTGNSTAGQTARYEGISVTLYGKGEAVAVSRSTGTAYLGKDILGSVRSTTRATGALEEKYEYDAFGRPHRGSLENGMNLGYTGKPYDATTGMYNYGYRDYQPATARFTTVDPVRDGNNWFAYVNNDPVNWVDLWGLTASEKQSGNSFQIGQQVENNYTKGLTSVTTNHIVYVLAEGEGFAGGYTTLTHAEIKQGQDDFTATVTVISISGPQLKHDDIQYFGQATLVVDNKSVVTKTLQEPKQDYLINTTSRMIGEASFNLPKTGEVKVVVSGTGYSYNNPEGWVVVSSLNTTTINISKGRE
jgi:RHS repeat-associated protein